MMIKVLLLPETVKEAEESLTDTMAETYKEGWRDRGKITIIQRHKGGRVGDEIRHKWCPEDAETEDQSDSCDCLIIKIRKHDEA